MEYKVSSWLGDMHILLFKVLLCWYCIVFGLSVLRPPGWGMYYWAKHSIALGSTSWISIFWKFVHFPYFPLTLDHVSFYFPCPLPFISPVSSSLFSEHLCAVPLTYYPALNWSGCLLLWFSKYNPADSSHWHWVWWTPPTSVGMHTLSPYRSLLRSALVSVFQPNNGSSCYQYSAGMVSCAL